MDLPEKADFLWQRSDLEFSECLTLACIHHRLSDRVHLLPVFCGPPSVYLLSGSAKALYMDVLTSRGCFKVECFLLTLGGSTGDKPTEYKHPFTSGVYNHGDCVTSFIDKTHNATTQRLKNDEYICRNLASVDIFFLFFFCFFFQ